MAKAVIDERSMAFTDRRSKALDLPPCLGTLDRVLLKGFHLSMTVTVNDLKNECDYNRYDTQSFLR